MRFFGFLLLSVCLSSPACAGWQGTEWGMTVEEVKEALGSIELTKPQPDIEMYEMPFSVNLEASGTIKTKAVFHFSHKTNKLFAVSFLGATDEECNKIKSGLLSVYGKPLVSETDSMSKNEQWMDSANDNIIKFSVIDAYKPVNCSVNYSKVIEKNQKGGL